ncbi:DeoR/GlpR family DNA-binding transcription regulator [Sphingobacterium sp. Mn56C]|uniref:DeoR/GlpR family DNA-binding transcription regulator n=1 Tax=Sphingobacterium sp. Mn56C TaxID=3395261 RepID=UPI003BE64C39
MKETKLERHNFILGRIKKDRKISMTALAKELQVSAHTVRRDLKELSTTGLLTAVRGGAMVKSVLPFNRVDRSGLQLNEKTIIAEKAVTLLADGMLVFMDAGTTIEAIAGFIPDSLRITVVTHSFAIANILASHPGVKLIFAGGELCPASFSTQGSQTIDTFRKINADICFLGVCSMDSEAGISARTWEEAALKQVMCRQSKTLVAAATFHKLGHRDPFFVVETGGINYLITEKTADMPDFLPYKQQNIQII